MPSKEVRLRNFFNKISMYKKSYGRAYTDGFIWMSLSRVIDMVCK